MDFNSFFGRIAKLKEIPLPAGAAHSLLASSGRMDQLKSIFPSNKPPRKAAVLLHMYPDLKGCTHFVLMQRAQYAGDHSGQISFPGGKPEPSDRGLWETAVREAKEEIGLDPAGVKCVRSLSELYVPPSNFLITPFLSYGHSYPVFEPDPLEVSYLMEISLSDLLDAEPVIRNQPTSYASQVAVPAFVFGPHVVWGATAMILSEFKALFGTRLLK